MQKEFRISQYCLIFIEFVIEHIVIIKLAKSRGIQRIRNLTRTHRGKCKKGKWRSGEKKY